MCIRDRPCNPQGDGRHIALPVGPGCLGGHRCDARLEQLVHLRCRVRHRVHGGVLRLVLRRSRQEAQHLEETVRLIHVDKRAVVNAAPEVVRIIGHHLVPIARAPLEERSLRKRADR
eukprot:6044391-Lingulodinium_polyedra.AAC.1